jgi:hypothetical protein
MVFPVLEEHIEGGQAAVNPSDVLLKIHLVRVGQLLLGIDLLFHDAQPVAHHDDFVEEGFHWHLLGLQPIVSRLQEDCAAVPTVAKFDGGGFDVLLDPVDLLFKTCSIAEVKSPKSTAPSSMPASTSSQLSKDLLNSFSPCSWKYTRQKSPSWLKMTPSP